MLVRIIVQELLFTSPTTNLFVCCVCREAIDRGLQALSKVVPGGDTLMNLGLEMVRRIQNMTFLP